jgi:tetratricopeptide (TPR) repeat protein
MMHSYRWVALVVSVAMLAAPDPVARAASSDSASSPAQTAQPGYADAKAEVAAGNYKRAIAILATVVEADQGNADAWNLLGYSSRKLGRMDKAARYYEIALRLNPAHRGALEYQGEMFIQTGAFDKAKANLNKLKKICGSCEESSELEAQLAAAGQS